MKVLTARQLADFYPPFPGVFCYDSSYAVPTIGWLTDKFYPWFRETRWNGDLSRWTRKNDCDNFARAYCVFAQDAHALSADHPAEGLAVGEFCYHSPEGPHAIVTAITDAGRVFIEPQNGAVLSLPESVVLTCYRVSF